MKTLKSLFAIAVIIGLTFGAVSAFAADGCPMGCCPGGDCTTCCHR
jgi:hypothetical protein